MKTLESFVFDHLKRHKKQRPMHIKKAFGISRTTTHKVIKNLLQDGLIKKTGKVPSVYYRIVKRANIPE